ncbi:MAG TPA: hypothetical protein VKS01_10195 [Bryobacteraceae bacterium]|nr:hypothetical protein [Bryobacteraceae bacterium]
MLAALLASVAWAADGDRAKIPGKWQSQSDSNRVLTVEDNGDVIHITRSEGDQKVTEFECAIGQECQVKDAGKKVKVSMYYNGPKLIELETRGDEVVKRRFTAGDADTMQLEVIPISGDSIKAETVTFKRVSAQASK